MKALCEYSKDELLELLEIKNKQIAELRKELDIYIELTKEFAGCKQENNESSKA